MADLTRTKRFLDLTTLDHYPESPNPIKTPEAESAPAPHSDQMAAPLVGEALGPDEPGTAMAAARTSSRTWAPPDMHSEEFKTVLRQRTGYFINTLRRTLQDLTAAHTKYTSARARYQRKLKSYNPFNYLHGWLLKHVWYANCLDAEIKHIEMDIQNTRLRIQEQKDLASRLNAPAAIEAPAGGPIDIPSRPRDAAATRTKKVNKTNDSLIRLIHETENQNKQMAALTTQLQDEIEIEQLILEANDLLKEIRNAKNSNEALEGLVSQRTIKVTRGFSPDENQKPAKAEESTMLFRKEKESALIRKVNQFRSSAFKHQRSRKTTGSLVERNQLNEKLDAIDNGIRTLTKEAKALARTNPQAFFGRTLTPEQLKSEHHKRLKERNKPLLNTPGFRLGC
ncbi:MAG: hypothetical protein K0U23_09055 [Gammaproteobacteria bacterium]|nr:hypothetical protein [Gammaproteobacteria bacterium]